MQNGLFVQDFKRFPSTRLTTYQSWPALQCLTIYSFTINLSVVTYLVKCSLPHLLTLQLSECVLDLHTATRLSEGNWPQLKSLSLSGCIPCPDVLRESAKGRWPRLADLSIDCCKHGKPIQDPVGSFASKPMAFAPNNLSHWVDLYTSVSKQSAMQMAELVYFDCFAH